MEFDFVPEQMPEKPENVKLASPSLLSLYRDLKNRTIWINDEITTDILEITKYIVLWNKEDKDIPVEERKPIKLFIFSVGGCVYSSYHLIDIIRSSKTPVYGYNLGLAASAAFLILINCHKSFGTKNSTALIHQGSGGYQGNATDVINSVENYKWMLKTMKEMIFERTKIPTKLYNSKMKEDWYLTSDEQLKYGIIDDIIVNIEELM